MRKLLLATVALAALTYGAQAGTITLQASEDGGPTTSVPFPISFGTVGPITFGDFLIGNLSGLTNPLLAGPPNLLQADQISVGTSAGGTSHTLHLTVLGLGLTDPTGAAIFNSQFDATGITAGWSVHASTDLNGVLVDQTTFTGIGSTQFFTAVNLPGTFDVSAHWDITTNGIAGSSNTGININAAPVPGPLAGAGIPGLLSALGMYGFAWRRRRNKAAA